jgi:hypothetical protein
MASVNTTLRRLKYIRLLSPFVVFVLVLGLLVYVKMFNQRGMLIRTIPVSSPDYSFAQLNMTFNTIGGSDDAANFTYGTLSIQLIELPIRPGDRVDPRPDAGTYPWTAVDIPQPFHMRFERNDGTLTDPIPLPELDREHPSINASSLLRWAPDGQSLVWVHGGSQPLTIGENLNVRVFTRGMWNCVILSILATVIAALFLMNLDVSHSWLHKRASRCEACNYDLSGQTEPGCPECGTGRIPPRPDS